MKVAHFSLSDATGGAAIACQRLHQGLCRIGVDSHLFVHRKTSHDARIHLLRQPQTMHTRIRARVARWSQSRQLAHYADTKRQTLEIFSDDRASVPNGLTAPFDDVAVHHLHWTSGFLDWQKFFGSFPQGLPLVWTMHDMNVFTGGCHYTLGCERYSDCCGSCPQLGSVESHDITTSVLTRKSAWCSELVPETTRFVAASKWMLSEARKSSLLRRFEIVQIPYGLDTDVFAPRDRSSARAVFSLPSEAVIILFAADSIHNHRKGFDLLLLALRDITCDRRVLLVTIGGEAAQNDKNCYGLGRVDDNRLLSLAYSAADVFVTPARAEAFGQVICESMACGTPVVGFDVGGIRDLIRHGINGLLAAPEQATGLKAAIETVINDDERRSRMSRACRRIAIEEYGIERQARHYEQLYAELVLASDELRQSTRNS